MRSFTTDLQHLAWNSADRSKSIGHVHRFLFYICPVLRHLGCQWKLLLFFCSSQLLQFSTVDAGQITLLDQDSAWCFACILLEEPREQKATLIIILMAPLYVADSFIGLLGVNGSKAIFMILNSVKECCEALVLSPINWAQSGLVTLHPCE